MLLTSYLRLLIVLRIITNFFTNLTTVGCSKVEARNLYVAKFLNEDYCSLDGLELSDKLTYVNGMLAQALKVEEQHLQFISDFNPLNGDRNCKRTLASEPVNGFSVDFVLHGKNTSRSLMEEMEKRNNDKLKIEKLSLNYLSNFEKREKRKLKNEDANVSHFIAKFPIRNYCVDYLNNFELLIDQLSTALSETLWQAQRIELVESPQPLNSAVSCPSTLSESFADKHAQKSGVRIAFKLPHIDQKNVVAALQRGTADHSSPLYVSIGPLSIETIYRSSENAELKIKENEKMVSDLDSHQTRIGFNIYGRNYCAEMLSDYSLIKHDIMRAVAETLWESPNAIYIEEVKPLNQQDKCPDNIEDALNIPKVSNSGIQIIMTFKKSQIEVMESLQYAQKKPNSPLSSRFENFEFFNLAENQQKYESTLDLNSTSYFEIIADKNIADTEWCKRIKGVTMVFPLLNYCVELRRQFSFFAKRLTGAIGQTFWENPYVFEVMEKPKPLNSTIDCPKSLHQAYYMQETTGISVNVTTRWSNKTAAAYAFNMSAGDEFSPIFRNIGPFSISPICEEEEIDELNAIPGVSSIHKNKIIKSISLIFPERNYCAELANGFEQLIITVRTSVGELLWLSPKNVKISGIPKPIDKYKSCPYSLRESLSLPTYEQTGVIIKIKIKSELSPNAATALIKSVNYNFSPISVSLGRYDVKLNYNSKYATKVNDNQFTGHNHYKPSKQLTRPINMRYSAVFSILFYDRYYCIDSQNDFHDFERSVKNELSAIFSVNANLVAMVGSPSSLVEKVECPNTIIHAFRGSQTGPSGLIAKFALVDAALKESENNDFPDLNFLMTELQNTITNVDSQFYSIFGRTQLKVDYVHPVHAFDGNMSVTKFSIIFSVEACNCEQIADGIKKRFADAVAAVLEINTNEIEFLSEPQYEVLEGCNEMPENDGKMTNMRIDFTTATADLEVATKLLLNASMNKESPLFIEIGHFIIVVEKVPASHAVAPTEEIVNDLESEDNLEEQNLNEDSALEEVVIEEPNTDFLEENQELDQSQEVDDSQLEMVVEERTSENTNEENVESNDKLDSFFGDFNEQIAEENNELSDGDDFGQNEDQDQVVESQNEKNNLNEKSEFEQALRE